MALPVLDGNQSATTLSSVVTGGEHIVAHSVVSLGSTAIANITSAVSGSSVSISNFPSTQTIAGTVTVSNATTASAVFVKICGERNGGGTNEAREIQTDDSGLLYVRLAPSNSLTSDPVIYDPVAGTAYINVRQQSGTSITVGNSVTIGSLPAISGTVTVGGFSAVSVGSGALLAGGRRSGGVEPLPLDIATGYLQTKVESLPSVTIGSLPAISGTVTAILADQLYDSGTPVFVAAYLNSPGGAVIPVSQDANAGMPISGTVTANLPTTGAFGGNLQGYNGVNTYINAGIESVGGNSLRAGGTFPVSGTITVGNSVTIGSLPAISGTVTANLANVVTTDLFWSTPAIKITGGNGYGIDIAGEDANGNRAIFDEGGGVPVFPRESSGNFPIAGTVTAAAPNGSLTTRFGTPTTANTAFATSAVTNASRKYLLIQNVTTGSNVITVGIGFTPTTTQGIQLTAGAGITFESSYIPTGAVYVLSSVTASNFTILEA